MKEKLKKWMLIGAPSLVLLCGLCYSTGILSHILNLPQSESVYDAYFGTESTLWTDKSYYKKGEPIHIRFTVENTSDEPIVLEREDEPVMDISVGSRPPVPSKLYKWSEINPDDAMLLHQIELQPGEKYVIELILTDYEQGLLPYNIIAVCWQRPDDRSRSVQLGLWFGPFDRFIPPLP